MSAQRPDDGELCDGADPALELSAAQQSEITAEIQRIAEGRQTINHVCGMLMLVYGIDADAAFELLKWRSQQTNVKIRSLAERFVVEVAALPHAVVSDVAAIDGLLMTVHERVTGGAG